MLICVNPTRASDLTLAITALFRRSWRNAIMADFTQPELQLDVKPTSGNVGAEAAYPRALQISLSDAEQVFPSPGGVVNTALLFAGIARFGQDSNDNGSGPGPLTGNPDEFEIEDHENRFDDSLEVDHGRPRTLELELELWQQQYLTINASGSTAFAAIANAGLRTTDPFGVSTIDALVDLVKTDPSGFDLGQKDFYFFSDVFAEEGSQFNRLAYQATALVNAQSLMAQGSTEILVPHFGDVIDLDVANPQQVATPRALDMGILDGIQASPGLDDAGNPTTSGANRLLIFTGTALCNFSSQEDRVRRKGVVRIRLQFPLPGNLLFKGTATVASLASVHGNDEASSFFGANAARIVTDPTDPTNPNPLPQLSPALPANELYLLVDVATEGTENGARPGISRVAYQANVLVQDTNPDLDSILVSTPGEGNFQPSVIVLVDGSQPSFFDLQVRLTAAVPQSESFFGVVVESDDLTNVPLAQLIAVAPQTSSTIQSNNFVLGTAPNETVTITATGTRAVRTAQIIIQQNINK
jgi:hypothetical protein